jgi:hypothetical protein
MGAHIGLMATVEQQHPALDDMAVFDWRFEVLMHAGYLPDQAWSLATNRDVDVRLAERLLIQGCPRSTAVRILI